MKQIYLDNAATTKIDERVFEAMKPYLIEKYGNASSQHILGKEAKEAIEKAREIIAKSINADKNEIYFTSGGTESNNWALKELFFANQHLGKKHIITTKIEHASIIETCKMLEKIGAKVTYLDVDKGGFVDVKEIEKAITKETILVSIIHGNNEIGTLQNIGEIGRICKGKNVYFHVDACQSYTKAKEKINVQRHNISLLTLNSHKIHGPKGVGALFIEKNVKIEAFIHGGGHENGKRSGTENVPGIVGFGKAVEIASERDIKNITKIRDYAIKKILEIPNTKLNGPEGKNRLCNNINVSFGNIEGESIGQYLEAYGIMVSTGSACASNTLKKSHVLKAIGLNDNGVNSSIRISLSKYITKEEIDYFIEALRSVVDKLRKISPFK
jgi:cysteine desulfurase